MFYCTSVAEEIPRIQKDTNNGALRHTLCYMIVLYNAFIRITAQLDTASNSKYVLTCAWKIYSNIAWKAKT
jgi:hypothetical protein